MTLIVRSNILSINIHNNYSIVWCFEWRYCQSTNYTVFWQKKKSILRMELLSSLVTLGWLLRVNNLTLCVLKASIVLRFSTWCSLPGSGRRLSLCVSFLLCNVGSEQLSKFATLCVILLPVFAKILYGRVQYTRRPMRSHICSRGFKSGLMAGHDSRHSIGLKVG